MRTIVQFIFNTKCLLFLAMLTAQYGYSQVEVSGTVMGSDGSPAAFANIIVKGKDCRSQDVLELSKKMAELVKGKFNLHLEREVRFVGKFSGMKVDQNQIIW